MRHQNNLRKRLIPPFERRIFFRFVSYLENGKWSVPVLTRSELFSRSELAEGWRMIDQRTADIYIPAFIPGRRLSAIPACPAPPEGASIPERRQTVQKKNFKVFGNAFFDALPEDFK